MQRSTGVASNLVRWSDAVWRGGRRSPTSTDVFTVGVLPGEGVGPEVVDAALRVLSAVEKHGRRFAVRRGGPIGNEAELLTGRPLTDDVATFCEGVFAAGGAVLAGPGGGRFVYDLRARFDLFCKVSPLRPLAELAGAGKLKPHAVASVDVLIVRENVGGVYMGTWKETSRPGDGRVAEHAFEYAERHVRRILEAAAFLAAGRRGKLAVAVKENGVPAVSALWSDLAREICPPAGVHVTCVDIDLAAYRLVQEPATFDVVVAPNLFGDVLADLGAVLLGSRGVSFSGNFSPQGAAVYQTNHGAAKDLAGTDRANPIGQIFAVAMMLRESFGLAREAAWIEASVADVLRDEGRTFDIAEDGVPLVGTAEMGERIATRVERRARSGEE